MASTCAKRQFLGQKERSSAFLSQECTWSKGVSGMPVRPLGSPFTSESVNVCVWMVWVVISQFCLNSGRDLRRKLHTLPRRLAHEIALSHRSACEQRDPRGRLGELPIKMQEDLRARFHKFGRRAPSLPLRAHTRQRPRSVSVCKSAWQVHRSNQTVWRSACASGSVVSELPYHATPPVLIL